jgi:hypothetical protein
MGAMSLFDVAVLIVLFFRCSAITQKAGRLIDTGLRKFLSR